MKKNLTILALLFIFGITSVMGVIAPTISSFTPATGSVGTLVSITGSDLSDPTAFTIGGVTAIVVSNTGNTLVGMVMPGAVTGNVSVTTAGGNAISTGNFIVTPTPYPSIQQGNKLVGTGNIGTAQQGYSVFLSADGNTAIVGGQNDNSGQGAAWIYIRLGSTWSQQGNKLVGTGNTGAALQGNSVSLSADGNTAIVGGVDDNSGQGAAWIFTRSGSIWSQQGNKLVGTGNIGAAAQGMSVSLSADGNTAIVGGENDNSGQGATWVYIRIAGVWSQQGSKLVGAGVTNTAMQGNAVSLSADGNTAIVGGNGDNSLQGAVWVFTRTAGIWSQQGNKLVGTGNTGAAQQGSSVSLSADGNTAIVGGDHDSNGSNGGAAWVFTRTAGIWSQQGNKLVGTNCSAIARFGWSVSLSADGNTAIVGGYFDSAYQGATWAYSRSAGIWSQQGNKLVGTGSIGSNVYQGSSVSLSANGSTAIVGGFADNSQQGAAWIYTGVSCSAPNISSQSTTAQTQCLNDYFTPITVTAIDTGLAYQWYKNTNANYYGGFALGADYGAQTNSYTPQATSVGSLYYYCVVTGNCGADTSDVSGAFITNIATAPNATTTYTYCQGSTAAQLSATGSGLLWYTVASGGTGSATAPTPSTATAGTTHYYVSQTVSSCESPRTDITVAVNATPAAPTATQTINYCIGDVASQLTATGSSLLWYTVASGGTGSFTASTPSTSSTGNTSYYVSQTINGCESPRTQINVVVYAIPPTPVVTQSGNDLLSNAVSGNQWYDQTGILNGSTSFVYSPTIAGYYYVIVTVNGCSSQPSTIFSFVFTGIENQTENTEVLIYPNPTSGEVILEFPKDLLFSHLFVYNSIGQMLFEKQLDNCLTTSIDLSVYATGVYFMHLTGEKPMVVKVVKN